MLDSGIPIHPVLVHFPLALAFLLPLFALGGALAIARGWLPSRAWAFVLAMHVVLALGAWRAEEAGHHDEERVEKVVPEDAIHEHEERAETFVLASGLSCVVTALGLLAGGAGGAARAGSVVVGLGLAALALRTGESGGELVWKHGAASAWVEKAALPADEANAHEGAHAHDDDADDGDEGSEEDE